MDECKQALNDEEMEQVNGGRDPISDKKCPRCGCYVTKSTNRWLGETEVTYRCLTCGWSESRPEKFW